MNNDIHLKQLMQEKAKEAWATALDKIYQCYLQSEAESLEAYFMKNANGLCESCWIFVHHPGSAKLWIRNTLPHSITLTWAEKGRISSGDLDSYKQLYKTFIQNEEFLARAVGGLEFKDGQAITSLSREGFWEDMRMYDARSTQERLAIRLKKNVDGSINEKMAMCILRLKVF